MISAKDIYENGGKFYYKSYYLNDDTNDQSTSDSNSSVVRLTALAAICLLIKLWRLVLRRFSFTMDSRSWNRFLEVLECSLLCHGANIIKKFLRAVTNSISDPCSSSRIKVPPVLTNLLLWNLWLARWLTSLSCGCGSPSLLSSSLWLLVKHISVIINLQGHRALL